METWQKDHIRKNLQTLIQNTICSSSFFASLFADGIVSDEEVQILEAIGTQMAQAKRLYEILQTRKNSYNLLKQALKDTAQSGALAILDQCSHPNFPIPFKNCGSISYIRDLLLGRGCYGTRVFKGTFENRDVAVKRLNRDEVEMADVKAEITFLTLLDSHKNVVRYFKTEVSDEYIFIALELCDVNLFDWVIRLPKTVEIGAIEVIKQTTKGVAHLHTNRVIHRDLKPSNILLVSRSVGDTQVKISDFGLSKRIPVGISKLSGHTVGVGTVEWMAPEVAGGLSPVNNVAVGMSFASDVFSLGCIYYFVLSSGLHPFGEASRCQGNILDGKYQLNEQNITAFGGSASGFIELISKMISHERRNRPSIFEALTCLPDVVISKNSVDDPAGQPIATLEESGYISCIKNRLTEKPSVPNQWVFLEFSFINFLAAKDKLMSGHAVDENPGNVGIKSAMNTMSLLAKVDKQNDIQITKLQGTEPATPDVQLSNWEEAKEHKLHLAIRRGDMLAIQEQIRLGADVNAKNSKNEAPLMIAVAASKVDGNMTYDILKYLIEHGADVFDTDSGGHTFLHKLFLKTTILITGSRPFLQKLFLNTTTIESRIGAFIRYLVEKKLSSLFNIQDKTFGTTPLMLAARNGKLDMATILLLIQNGVDLTLVDKNGSSYLYYDADGNKSGKLLAKLKKNGDIKHSTLAKAIRAMDGDSVKVLVKLGADVNETNDELETPLHLAAGLKNRAFAIPIIKLLIDFGANVDAKDKYDHIFLHVLVGWMWNMTINPTQFDDIATYLISKGLSRLFNTPDTLLRTPLLEAVYRVEIERATLSLLKNNGVDINAADKAGRSLLYYATVANRTLRMISDLVDLGANPNHLTNDKESMLHRAALNGNANVVKFFVDKGLGINAQDRRGKTPLRHALDIDLFKETRKENTLKTVQLLLQNGAESDIVDIYGKSPRVLFNENRDMYPEADQISTCFSLGSSC